MRPFLSYASCDRAEAAALVDSLRPEGLDPWWHRERMRVGQKWIDQLETGLATSNAFIILIGKRGVDRWVRAECGVALNRHFGSDAEYPIIPIFLPEAAPETLPPFLASFQGLSYAEATSPGGVAKIVGAAGKAAAFRLPEGLTRDTCPYPGFHCYDHELKAVFCGREKDTAKILSLLGLDPYGITRRWVHVHGTSGVGKSSLVRACIIPAVEAGWLTETDGATRRHWKVVTIRPGTEPLDGLANEIRRQFSDRTHALELTERIRRIKPPSIENEPDKDLAYALKALLRADERVLLFIDQFEELFTLAGGADDDKRKQILARLDSLLNNLLQDPESGTYLLTTMRSDFMLQFPRLPKLGERLNSPQAASYLLNPMDERSLRSVVRVPTQRMGVGFDEDTLPNRIVADALMAGEAALPLISNLMTELWRNRNASNKLQGSAYENLGGVGGALAKRADQVVTEFRSHQDAVREFFLALVSVGRDRPDTRKRISRDAALAAAGAKKDPKLAEQILVRFSGGRTARAAPDEVPIRLVNVSEDASNDAKATGVSSNRPANGQRHTVELAHEILLAYRDKRHPETKQLIAWWPTLRDWIDRHRADIESREELERRARQWEEAEHTRDSSLLVSGKTLATLKQLGVAPESSEERYLSACTRRAKIFAWATGAVLPVLVLMAVSLWWTNLSPMTRLELPMIGSLYAMYMRSIVTVREPDMVELPMKTPSDRFVMGSPEDEKGRFSDEGPQREVTISKFAIGKYEVTFEEYDAFVAATGQKPPSDQDWGRGKRPVINVSWEEAREYAQWLSKLTGKIYRLPSEAEWEYAARAGTTTARYWSDNPADACAYANVGDQSASVRYTLTAVHECDDKQVKTAVVGSYEANGFGLHDVLGNVWEWTEDCWHDNYEGAPTDGSAWTEGGDCGRRVLRGGSWGDGPGFVRSADRGWYDPVDRHDALGFRLARDLE